jgi:hypothetical protein
VGASFYGGFYQLMLGAASAAPVLDFSASSTRAFLIWLTNNAARFSLQQNTNPVPTGWLAVINLPVVTNQLYQITAPITNRQDFFWLTLP